MAPPTGERSDPLRAEVPSENTSLIPENSKLSNKGTFSSAPSPSRDSDPSDSGNEPTIKEKSTAELLLVMSSVWLGGILTAVDMSLIATLTSPISASSAL